MRLLFAISVACFCAVLWVVLSVARRVRLNRGIAMRRARPAVAQEFFEAGEFRTPRPLRLYQDLSLNRQRLPVSRISTPPDLDSGHKRSSNDLSPRPMGLRPILSYGSSSRSSSVALHPSEHDHPHHQSRLHAVAASVSVPNNDRSHVTSIDAATPAVTGRRKSPQSVSRSGLRRIDLSHYDNEESGDLTDPYTHPLRGSAAQGGSPRII